MAHQQLATLPVIAITYTARLGERIYWHLRQSMETSDKIDKKIDDVMKTPLKELAMRPSFQALMIQANLNANNNVNANTNANTSTDDDTVADTESVINTNTNDIPLRDRIRYHPGEALFPPGPDCS